MKLLYIFLKTCTAAVVCFSVATGPSSADDSESVVVSKLMKSAKGEKTPHGIRKSLCKKADFFGGKFSFRSGEGRACRGALGALALLTCKGYEDKDGAFEDSGCFKRAIVSVGGGDPEAKAEIIVVGALKSTASAVKPLVCMAAPTLLTASGIGAPAAAAIAGTCGAGSMISSF